MPQSVTTFNFAHGDTRQSIRMVTIDGEPWAVLKDVCRVLGFREHPHGGFSNTARHVDRDELMVVRKAHSKLEGIFDGTASQAQLVSESGLYKIVLRAHKSPVAKPFQDWVTKVVLPAIRKDGAYVMGEEKVATGELSEDELVLRAVSILQSKVERLRQEKEAALAKVAELAPKADIVDQYMDAKGTLNSSQVAKMLGFSSAQQRRRQRDDEKTLHSLSSLVRGG